MEPKEDQPLGPRRLDFSGLSPEDFELLCYLIVLLRHPAAIKLDDPDGGADSALPAEDRSYLRCWQSKRYTRQISWPKCVESLDRARATYGMPYYTFCFARDLTSGQEKLFKKHLVTRHRDVKVDYWNKSLIEGQLLSAEQGERITRYFYGDPVADAQAIARALRAGGELTTGANALERLEAVGQFLARNDPFFTYPASVRETAATSEASPFPGSVMAVEKIGSDTVERIEAVPRNTAALERLPEGTLFFENTPAGRAQLEELRWTLAAGGELNLEGVRLEFRQLPKLFEAMAPPSGSFQSVTVRAERTPPTPWNARFRVKSERGEASLDVLLTPTAPPSDWDGALSGAAGVLTATMLFRRRGQHGEMTMKWRYRAQKADLRSQAAALSFVGALHGRGTLEIEDLDQRRPTFTENLNGQPLDISLDRQRRLLEDLITIEEWTGITLELPDEVSAAELQAIPEAAYIIRSGQSRMKVDDLEVTVEPKSFAQLQEKPLFRIEMAFELNLFGKVLPLGFLSGVLPDVRVAQAQRVLERGRELVSIRLRPTTDAGRNPIFKLSKERPTPIS